MTSNSKAAGRSSKADFIYIRKSDEYQCPAGQRLFTTAEKDENIRMYWADACGSCAMKASCTTGKERRVRRWEHEEILRLHARLEQRPKQMTVRRHTVEHVFGTLKHWMGSTHFLTRGLANVSTEMSLQELAYNLKRVLSVLGMQKRDESNGTDRGVSLVDRLVALIKTPEPVIEATRRIQPTCMTLPRHQATASSPEIRPPGFPHSLGQQQPS